MAKKWMARVRLTKMQMCRLRFSLSREIGPTGLGTTSKELRLSAGLLVVRKEGALRS